MEFLITPILVGASTCLAGWVASDIKKLGDSKILGVGGNIVTGIAGNRIDQSVGKIKEKSQERFLSLSREERRKLERFARRAHLRATMEVCKAYRRELSSLSIVQKATRALTRPDDDHAWLDRAETYLNQQIALASDKDFQAPDYSTDKLKSMIADVAAQTDFAELTAEMSRAALAEMDAQVRVPPVRFGVMLLGGWQRLTAKGKNFTGIN